LILLLRLISSLLTLNGIMLAVAVSAGMHTADPHSRLGATVLMVTHDPAVAASCPRTITLRDGRIIEDTRR